MKIDYQIQLLDDVIIEIESAKIWYNSRVEGLVDVFVEEIRNGIDIIHSSPLLFPTYFLSHRKYICGRFPFRIFYKLNQRKHLIIITSVLHEKRSLINLSNRK